MGNLSRLLSHCTGRSTSFQFSLCTASTTISQSTLKFPQCTSYNYVRMGALLNRCLGGNTNSSSSSAAAAAQLPESCSPLQVPVEVSASVRDCLSSSSSQHCCQCSCHRQQSVYVDDNAQLWTARLQYLHNLGISEDQVWHLLLSVASKGYCTQSASDSTLMESLDVSRFQDASTDDSGGCFVLQLETTRPFGDGCSSSTHSVDTLDSESSSFRCWKAPPNSSASSSSSLDDEIIRDLLPPFLQMPLSKKHFKEKVNKSYVHLQCHEFQHLTEDSSFGLAKECQLKCLYSPFTLL